MPLLKPDPTFYPSPKMAMQAAPETFAFVYRKLGLAILRTAWINLDWLWAGALVVTGVVVLLK